MESLTQEPTETKNKSQVDRASIGKLESEKLSGWLKQIQETSKGFLDLTKSELVNFLIREHKPELSAKELNQLRHDHYDPFRHISWITQELKTAIASNDKNMVARLQNEIKGIELSVIVNAQSSDGFKSLESTPQNINKPKRKRVKKSDAEITPETVFTEGISESLIKA